MNKTELVAEVAEDAGVTKTVAARVIDSVLNTIKNGVKDGDVRLIGFGSFKTVNVAEKTVRNPRNGEPVRVPAGKRVKFSPGQDLKRAANS